MNAESAIVTPLGEFEGRLEAALRALSVRKAAAPLPPARFRHVRRRTLRGRLVLGIPALLGTKILVGASIVGVAAAGEGAIAVMTGSANPIVWHQSPPARTGPRGSGAATGGSVVGNVVTPTGTGRPGAHGATTSPRAARIPAGTGSSSWRPSPGAGCTPYRYHHSDATACQGGRERTGSGQSPQQSQQVPPQFRWR